MKKFWLALAALALAFCLMLGIALADNGFARSLHRGDTGEDVGRLQTRLQELGYYSGTIDSSYGNGTYQAVRAFQEKNNLSVDGSAGTETLNAIVSGHAIRADGTSLIPYTDKPQNALARGMVGLEVQSLQIRLKELGYYTGNIDSSYGQGTEDAVRAFQQARGLSVDGRAGSATLDALFDQSSDFTYTVLSDGTASVTAYTGTVATVTVPSYLGGYPVSQIDKQAFRNNTSVTSVTVPEGVSVIGTECFTGCTQLRYLTLPATLTFLGDDALEGTSGLMVYIPAGNTAIISAVSNRYGSAVTIVQTGAATPTPVPVTAAPVTAAPVTATPAPTAFVPETGKPSRSLHPGDSGADVGSLQLKLQSLGYYTGAINGYYDTLTENAVRSFQSRNSLAVDGRSGPATLGLLYSGSPLPAWQTPVPVTATPAPSGYTAMPTEALHKGATGVQVRSLQIRLKALGYYSGVIDSSFGSGTFTAVKNFQRDHGLTVDGRAGTQTLTALYDASLTTVMDLVGDYLIQDIGNGCVQLVNYLGSTSVLSVPATIGGRTVTSIGAHAFDGNTALTQVGLPDSITEIGNDCFKNCTALLAVNLPSELDSVGDEAFYGDRSLRSINLPEGMTSLGADAFRGCTALTYVNIPYTLSVMGANPFRGCSALSTLQMSSRQPYFRLINGVLFSRTNQRLIWYPLTRTDTAYTVPSGTCIIGRSAFRGNGSLRSIYLPDTVTTLQPYAFADMAALTNVTIPSTVTNIPDTLYDNTPGMQGGTTADGYTYRYQNSYSASITGYTGTLTYLTLPASVSSHTVTSVAANAFANTTVRLVTLQTGVTTIGSAAFANCLSLYRLYLPATVTSIADDAFSGSSALTLMIPATNTYARQYAISHSISFQLTGVTTPTPAATAVPTAAPASTNAMGYSYRMVNSKEVMITGYTGTSTALVIPSTINGLSVTRIADEAFVGSYSVTSVAIPSGITTIGKRAFAGCISLKTVIFPASITTIGTDAFRDTGSLTFYVPAGNTVVTNLAKTLGATVINTK